MDSYRRPAIEPAEFRDADGAVIEYGERWGAESPPDDSYSVLSNVERFRPLHRIAEALIDVLANDYAATVEDDLALASELMHDRDDVIRAVKVTPQDRAAAPVTQRQHPQQISWSGTPVSERDPIVVHRC